jgi:hypothetical protein
MAGRHGARCLRRSDHGGASLASLIVASIVLVLGLVAGGILFLVPKRPPAPPPSDPRAGINAATYCVDAFNAKLRDLALVISVRGADKVVKAISYTENSVKVVYYTQTQQTEEALYSFATFLTEIVGELKSPQAKIFGEIGPVWLACTKALQYFLQEKGKDAARALQDWVYGLAIEGDWTLTRTNLTCVNLPEGCASGPMKLQIKDCSATICNISRTDGGWKWQTFHEITRNQETDQRWHAEVTDFAAFCRGTKYFAAITIDLSIISSSSLTGTYGVVDDNHPAPCLTNGHATATYTFVGTR